MKSQIADEMPQLLERLSYNFADRDLLGSLLLERSIQRMTLEPDPSPPDKNRDPVDLDSTIAPSGSGASQPKASAKPDSDSDIDATIAPATRGASADDQRNEAVQSFAPRLERIGDCKIEKRLGVGGFGEVWLATQESDLLKRRVAIKLLKRGMDSESVLRRFDLERKVLSTLNHQNISRLLGAGMTEDGRSYFIMEFVEGLTLDIWCKRQNLSVSERLAIFRQVCSAVAHAHSLGIVHRDLKPANVIVGPDGVPKLLDFGIAKIINSEVSAADSAQTLPGDIGPLTPIYASPEQLRGEPLVASTDIYSLGVILYETLTEQLPFDFTNLSFDEIRRKACESEPPLPSNACAKTSVSVGETHKPGELGRTTIPEGSKDKLRRRLRGDIDNIVLMAMRKEPGRRYATVDALIADLDAHAADMTVSARPNSTSYRAQKWAHRNKSILAVGISAAIVLGIGWAIFAGLARNAQKQIDENRKAVNQRVVDLGTGDSFLKSPEKSLMALGEQEKIYRSDLQKNSKNSTVLRLLAINLQRQVALHNDSKNIKDGLRVSGEYLALINQLYALTQKSTDQIMVTRALQSRGDILFAGKDFVEAKKMYEESLRAREQILKDNPDDLAAARAVGLAIVRMRELSIEEGNLEANLNYSTRLVNVRSKNLKQAKGGDTSKVEYDWLLACLWHAEDLRNLDRLDEAQAQMTQYLAMANARAQSGDSARKQDELSWGEGLLCKIYLDKQDWKNAMASANRMCKAARQSVELSNALSASLNTFIEAGVMKSRIMLETQDAEGALDLIDSTVLSAKNYRKNSNVQITGVALSDEFQLMMNANKIWALRLLGRIDETRLVAQETLALTARPEEGASWYAAISTAYSQIALVTTDSVEALRLSRLGVEFAQKTKDLMLEIESREILIEVLKKIGPAQELKLEIANINKVSTQIKRPRVDAIMKKILGVATSEAPKNNPPVGSPKGTHALPVPPPAAEEIPSEPVQPPVEVPKRPNGMILSQWTQ